MRHLIHPSSPFSKTAAVLSGLAFDPSAQAYFTAAGITDPTLKVAHNNLALNMKTGLVNGGNIFAKFTQLLLLTNGDISANEVNFVNPGTKDGILVNSPTVALSGTTLDGATQFIRNQINASTELTLNDFSFTFAIRNAPAAINSAFAMGVYTSSISQLNIRPRLITDVAAIRSYSTLEDTIANTTGGLFTGTRRANNDLQMYKGATAGTPTTTVETKTPPSLEIFTGCLNNAGTENNFLASNEWFLTGIMSGFTTADVQDWNAAYNQWISDLGI